MSTTICALQTPFMQHLNEADEFGAILLPPKYE
jgi:hypothetical protein